MMNTQKKKYFILSRFVRVGDRRVGIRRVVSIKRHSMPLLMGKL